MDPERFASLPYLQAIQKLPGDTASEKLGWIGRFISQCTSECEDYSQVPHELQPLFNVELSVKLKNHKFLTQALKSEDTPIVNRIFKATWFFEGTDETVNCEYFWKNIFPSVSVRTRTRIVKTLGRRVKNPMFAQQMFAKLVTAYDMKTASSLIVCCDENFIFYTIVKRKFLLPNGILKKIFRRNLELGLQLLLEYIEHYESYLKNTKEFMKKKSPQIHVQTVIKKYMCFLHVLAKNSPRDFANLIKRVPICSEIIYLSNKCAKKFLKGAMDIVVEKPELYLCILSVKIVNAKQMELLLPGLIKYECINDFCLFFYTDKLLTYLNYYPVETRVQLLFYAYKSFYHHDLLCNMKNVTPNLLRLLPINQRIDATKKLMKKYPQSESSPYALTWICYLPIKKSIPAIKRRLKQASQSESKVRHISYMLYTCTVNNDKKKLSEILQYILNEKYIKNMTTQVFEQLMNNIKEICNLPHTTLKNGTLVLKIVEKFFAKYGYVPPDFLKDLIHFRLVHNLDPTDLMSMLFTTNDNYLLVNFNMIECNPYYERLCLLAFIDFIEKHYINWYEEKSQEERQAKEDEDGQQQNRNEIERKIKIITLCRFVAAMYDFNKKYQDLHVRTKRMTIKDHPVLLDAIRTIMCSQINFHFRKTMQKLLRQYEGELYRSWFLANTSENIADVTSGAALRLLKRNPQSVLDNWEEYLTSCKKHYRQKHVQRFLRAVCWYKDIPLKFAKRCIDNLNVKNIEETLSDLIVLGILLGSETFKKLLESFLSKEIKLYDNRVDIRNTDDPMLASILRIFTLCNLPVPMEIVANLFTESQSCVEKSTLLRVIVRASFDDVLLFEERLPMMCTLMRKHWIDIMCSLGSLQYRVNFLFRTWKTEKDQIIRENIFENSVILFRNIRPLLLQFPNPATSLLKRISMSFTLDDVHLLKKWKEYFSGIDKKYMWIYCEVWLVAVKRLSEVGLHSKFTRMYAFIILKKLDSLNLESDFPYFMKKLFTDFLFCENTDISSVMRYYTLLYFSEWFHKNADYREIYWKMIIDVFRHIKTYRRYDLENIFSYPTKNSMFVFLYEFVIRYIRLFERVNYPLIIDDLLNMFSSNLSRLRNAKTYLLLKYARILYNCRRIQFFAEYDFGRELAHYLPDLVDTFSEFLISLMAEILELFVKTMYTSDDYLNIMNFIMNGLMNVDHRYAIFMTMTMLSSMQQKTQLYYSFDILQSLDYFYSNINHSINTA